MICLYPEDCLDFTTNGLAVLTPSSAIVKETLNGNYELTLEHPIDDQGKWSRLKAGCIVRAPVPIARTPGFRMVTRDHYDIYKVNGENRPVRARPASHAAAIASLADTTKVVILSEDGNWLEVTSPEGVRGYMYRTHLTYYVTKSTREEAEEEVITAGQLRDQPFRIYRVVPDLEKVTVYARHVFYDLLDNMLRSVHPSRNMRGSDVVQAISDACLTEHNFRFYSNLTSKCRGVQIDNRNPVDAILGDGGIIENYGGELLRDWYDVYVVKQSGRDTGVCVRQGKNLTGIRYDVDMTNVVTRIMPTGQDKDGNVLYLPELFVDSERIDLYPSPKWIHLPLSDCREVAEGDDTKTKSECYAEMREAAQAEFDKGCDVPAITLTVEFVDVNETEEYSGYRFLRDIFLGDTVHVISERIGVEAAMRMTEYSYNCLTRQYEKMTLGTVANTVAGSIITARQLPQGIITGGLLALGAVSTGHLGSGTITARHLQADSISAEAIQAGAITARTISAGAITADAIAAQAITADKISANSISTESLQAGSVTADKIAAGTITAESIEAVRAHIRELVAGEITADQLYTDLATIATAQISTAHIDQAEIDWASIQNLTTQIAQIATAQIGTASLQQATIDWAQIANLNAQIATIADAHIQNATITTAQISDLTAQIARVTSLAAQAGHFDFAHVRDLVADAMVLEQGVGGSVYIENLAATSAMLAQATLGELVLKGTDGKYYELLAEADGTLRTKQVTVTQGEIEAGQTASGRAIVETNANITNLNAKDIQAQSAVISQIMAKAVEAEKITAGQAFIAMASIPELAATAITALQGSLTISGDHVRIQSSGSGDSSLATVLDSLRGDATAAMQAVSGLGVGGVNLVDDSEKIIISGSGAIEYADATCYRILNRALEAGRTYTLSMASATLVSGSAPGMSLDVWRRPASGSDALLFRRTLDFSGGHQKTTFTLPDDGSTYYILIFAGIVNSSSGVTVELTKVKLEEGTFATTWTASQADAEAPLTALRTTLETYPGGFGALVEHVTGELDGAASDLYSFFRFYSDSANVPHLEMGASDSDMKMDLTNSRLSFKMNGREVAYFSDNKLYVTNVEAIERMSVGTPLNGYLEMVTTDTGVGFLWRA